MFCVCDVCVCVCVCFVFVTISIILQSGVLNVKLGGEYLSHCLSPHST